MTEITTANLFKLFAGEQNINDMRWLGEDIYFIVGRFDIDSEQIETYYCSITQSDLKDIFNVFTDGMRSLPTTEYLLLVLWIREEKFKTDSLLELDRLDFVKNAFALNGIEIAPETIAWEFMELLRRECISEGITEVEGYIDEGVAEVEQIKDYFLSPTGKRVAEELFEAMKKPANASTESLPIARKTANDMRQVAVEFDKQASDLADMNVAAKKLIAASQKKIKLDLDTIIRGLFEQYPEAKTFTSIRLLLYLQGFAKKQGIEITVSDGRIRQLPVWKENATHRMSGKTQYRKDMGDAPDENAEDVNDTDYEMTDN